MDLIRGQRAINRNKASQCCFVKDTGCCGCRLGVSCNFNTNNMEEKATTTSDDSHELNVVKSKFGSEIDRYLRHIESQTDVVPLVMSLISVKLVQEAKLVDKFIKENGIIESEEGSNGEGKLEIPSDKIKEFIELNEKASTTSLAHKLLPINFVVSFVSQYDAFLGGLIRAMFIAKPELLNNSEKNIQFSELLQYSTIEDARESLIEKEVESVIRESHLKQFKWLEGKLNITLRKDLPSFNDFIEITERRNLFVHCNGIVSRQYLEVCEENQVKGIEKLKIGEQLIATGEYFNKCYMVLFEIGVKLGQVIWRKLKPEEIDDADTHLNNVCYQLLIKGHNKLALNLLTFATDVLKKYTDHEMLCIYTINKALAHYLSNNKEACNGVLEKHDWSATSDKFKLATAVLHEQYPQAIELMKSIGTTNKHVNKDAYREWPLFRQFRKTEDFKGAYKEIFNEEFVYIESKPKDLEDLLSELKQIKKEEKEKKAANEPAADNAGSHGKPAIS